MRYPALKRIRRLIVYDPDRKQLSRVVALAKYNLDLARDEISLGAFRKLILERARAALAFYDDHHPVEALAALERDGEEWNPRRYVERRNALLARALALRKSS